MIASVKRRVVASEGDSSFHLPMIVRPMAIATRIHDTGDSLYAVSPCGVTHGMLERKDIHNRFFRT